MPSSVQELCLARQMGKSMLVRRLARWRALLTKCESCPKHSKNAVFILTECPGYIAGDCPMSPDIDKMKEEM